MKIQKWKCVAFVSVLSSFGSMTLSLTALANIAAPTDAEIANFHQDNAVVFRGARPTEQGMQWLAQARIKTDIDLEDDMDAANQESAWAKQFGVTFASFPMNSYLEPSDALVTQILEVMVSPQAQPVFVHCHYGENRTGLIMAIYRVKFDGWSPQAAYEEMMSDGMTFTGRLALLPYFEKVTGLTPSN